MSSRLDTLKRAAEMQVQEEQRRVQQAPAGTSGPRRDAPASPQTNKTWGRKATPPETSTATPRARIVFCLPPELKLIFHQKAIASGRTMSSILNELVSEYVEG